MAPKQTLSIGGAALEYAKSGDGSPAIVLVNGSGGPIEGWFRLHAQLAALSTVFAYNRRGVGASGKPYEAQTGDVIVRDLRELLTRAGLTPPYLLVGHSLGGLFVNLFARSFPSEIAGAVLLDATAPEDVGVMASYETGFQRWARRALDKVCAKNPLAETENVTRTVELVRAAAPFPALALIVVTGGKPAMAWATPAAAREARAEHQRRLAALSPHGRQVIAERSGHFPQFTQPELVVQAVRDVLSLARASDPPCRESGGPQC
jgi:pimeloyl-ACP methyl ester carboxylesterase